MGVVLAARHAQLGQQVAVKVLLPAALKDPAAAERFLREARAAIAIKSEHVARVMDFGTLDSGAPYLVMEHLAGSDLKELLEANGPLPLNDVADYAIQACEALYEAHQRGIVHRDLKPANLFVTTRVDGSPLVKVLDFGISKTVSLAATASGSDRSITKTDAVFGTPAYMSPEQLRSSKQVDHRTDVWSMGAAIYELISGRLPFGSSGDGVVTMVAHILEDSPPSLIELRPEVPHALDALVARCLAKDAAARVQSAAELAEAIAPFASPASAETLGRIARMSVDSLPFDATVQSGSGSSSGRQTPPMAGGWGRTDGKTARRTRAGLLAGAAIVIVASIAAGWVLGTRSAARPGASGGEAASSAPATSSYEAIRATASFETQLAPPAPPSASAEPTAGPSATAASSARAPAAVPTRVLAQDAPKAAGTPGTAPVEESPKCDDGMVMSNGHCCRAGFEWKGGECVPGVAKGLR